VQATTDKCEINLGVG